MFTGIIQGLGTITERRPAGGGEALRVACGFRLDEPLEGESIAVNGVCLTAREITPTSFLADVSPETLSRSALGGLRPGAKVNLERALRPIDRLGGHIVSGHVDCVGRVLKRERQSAFTLFTFSLEPALARYVVEKGSIAVSGVSLTVNACAADSFSVSIIPHTLDITILGGLSVGDAVNVEVDIIGKYVEKLLGGADKAQTPARRLDAAFLAANGFF